MVNWLGQRLFESIHQNNLVYAACWEDPRVDRAALNLGSQDKILVITSAGCNVLDYVLEEPLHIHAVDLNYRQNALLDLKLAGIKELDWPDFFRMFAIGQQPQVREWYRDCLRHHLQEPHQRFWDRHLSIFCGRKPLYHRSTSGWFASWFRFYIDYIVRLKQPVRELLEAKNIEEQREIYDSKIREKIWRPLLGYCLKSDSTLVLSGIPPDQRRQIQRFQPDIVAYLQYKAEQTIYNLPLRQNYFWRAYITGKFTQDCCPRYLEETNFERLKSLTNRITFHTDSVEGFLTKSPLSFTHFVLLDHMDWLTGHYLSKLESEWQAIVNHAEPNAKILWRSLGLKTDFVDRVIVQMNGEDYAMGDLLEYDRTLANELIQQERANAYGSLYIASLQTPGSFRV